MAMSPTQQAFVDLLMPHAIQAAARTGVDPRIIIGQAAIETGWGRHAPNNNYFGIKSHGQSGGAAMGTTEYVNGQPVRITDSFRQYASPGDSVAGYADFLLQNPRYRSMMAAQGIDAQLQELGRSGYATDPNYANPVGSIARQITPSGGTMAAELGNLPTAEQAQQMAQQMGIIPTGAVPNTFGGRSTLGNGAPPTSDQQQAIARGLGLPTDGLRPYTPTAQPTGAAASPRVAGTPVANPFLRSWYEAKLARGEKAPVLERLLGISKQDDGKNRVNTIPMIGDASGTPAYGTGGFGSPTGYDGSPGRFQSNAPAPRPNPGQGMQFAPPTNLPVQQAQPIGGPTLSPLDLPASQAEPYEPPTTVAQPILPTQARPVGGQAMMAPPLNAPMTMAPTVDAQRMAALNPSPMAPTPVPTKMAPQTGGGMLAPPGGPPLRQAGMLPDTAAQPASLPEIIARQLGASTEGMFGSKRLQSQNAPLSGGNTPPPQMLAGGTGRPSTLPPGDNSGRMDLFNEKDRIERPQDGDMLRLLSRLFGFGGR